MIVGIPHDMNFLTLKGALDWFEDQSSAIYLFRKKIAHSIESDIIDDIPERFINLSLEQVSEIFNESLIELSLISCFQLISAAEGRLKYDFQLKLQGRSGTDLYRNFKKIFKNNGRDIKRINIEKNILEIWKEHYPSDNLRDFVGSFKGLMKFRHWVAHGRYWTPNKLGRSIKEYQPHFIYQEIKLLFNHLKEIPEGFDWE